MSKRDSGGSPKTVAGPRRGGLKGILSHYLAKMLRYAPKSSSVRQQVRGQWKKADKKDTDLKQKGGKEGE